MTNLEIFLGQLSNCDSNFIIVHEKPAILEHGSHHCYYFDITKEVVYGTRFQICTLRRCDRVCSIDWLWTHRHNKLSNKGSAYD